MTGVPEPQPIVDPQIMREVLGHFASGVTVVTAVTDDGPIGFTCQSFSSLSLDPPLVAFAPARTSQTWARLREIGQFCVNVLAEGQDDLSQRFARSGPDKFDGVPWTPSPHGNPVLEDSGVRTGLDLDAVLAAARVTEQAVGHELPSSLYRAGGRSVPRSAAARA